MDTQDGKFWHPDRRNPQLLTPKDSSYVDVSDVFFHAVESMPKGEVIASPYFDMLDGARAVEMGNVKLDTGLIELEHADLVFDPCGAQDAATVVSIMNSLILLYMTWVGGLSLLVTVLGFRHVLDFLENYKAHASVRRTDFVNRRLHAQDFTCGETHNDKLVNIVLRGFVVGLVKHIGFCRNVGISVLYDEEDMTTRSMDFDFLSQIGLEVVVSEIEKAETCVRTIQREASNDSHDSLEHCLSFLHLVKQLVLLENILLQQVKLFAAKDLSIPCIELALATLPKVATNTYVELPKGCVSRFVQLDCNNKHIPSPNQCISQEKAYEDLTKFLESVQGFVNETIAVRNVGQLDTLLQYSVAPRMTADYNVVARGLFQLFFIRDDKSIAGLDESVGSISIRLMERLSLCGNSLMKPEEWTIQGSGDQEALRGSCLGKVSQLIDDVEAAVFQKLSVCGNNRCRQRQLNNRNIVVWDLLQFHTEQTETELFSYGIGDRISPGVEQPALGVSSFVYFHKLGLMMDVALSGFEQQLYKPYEAAHMFWLAGYFAQLAFSHLQTRVSQINSGKLASIASLGKKIKKTKASAKKDAMRQSLRRLEETVVPQIHSNIAYIDKYLMPSHQAVAAACTTISHVVELLHSSSGQQTSASDTLIDKNTLYNLRMKPWSSVGVPEMPSFSQYSKINETYLVAPGSPRAIVLASDIKDRLSGVTKLFANLIALIELDDAVVSDIVYAGGESDILGWFQALQKTCVAYQVELSKFIKLSKENAFRPSTAGDGASYKLKARPGYHGYFPIYTLVQK